MWPLVPADISDDVICRETENCMIHGFTLLPSVVSLLQSWKTVGFLEKVLRFSVRLLMFFNDFQRFLYKRRRDTNFRTQ